MHIKNSSLIMIIVKRLNFYPLTTPWYRSWRRTNLKPAPTAIEHSLNQWDSRISKRIPLRTSSKKSRGRDKFRPMAVYPWVLAETVWLAPECARERSDDIHFAGLRSSARLLTHRQSGAPHFHSRCSVHGPLHPLSPASVLSHSHPPSSTRKWGTTACHRLL